MAVKEARFGSQVGHKITHWNRGQLDSLKDLGRFEDYQRILDTLALRSLIMVI